MTSPALNALLASSRILSVLWDSPGSWPKCGRDVIFLADAVSRVGRALFPDTWTGNETACSTPLPHPDELRRMVEDEKRQRAVRNASASRVAPAVSVHRNIAHSARPAPSAQETEPPRVPVDRADIARAAAEARAKAVEQWAIDNAARKRLLAAIEWVAERCRNGDLETHLRWVGGGDHFAVAANVWYVEPVIEKRFSECQAKVWSNASRQNLPAYIFVTRDSLTRCLTAIGAATVDGQDLAGLSPYLQIAVSLALKYRDDTVSKDGLVLTIKEAWKKLHGEDISTTAAEHIAATIRHPDKRAIEYGKKARSAAAPKKG